MKFNYDKETDALYINFVDIPGVDSYEIFPEYIADIDSNGNQADLPSFIHSCILYIQREKPYT